MKMYKVMFIAIVILVSACGQKKVPEVKTIDITPHTDETLSTIQDANVLYAKVEFGIDGMTCAMGCAKTIEKKIAKMDGVKTAKVDFDKGLAMVEYDEAKVSPMALENTVTSIAKTYIVKDLRKVDTFGENSQTD